MATTELTKRLIQSAFVELLNERSLSKITVRDITDRCGVNRNTFYYHYQSIPDLLEELCISEVDRFVREYPNIRSITECLNSVMEFVLKSKRAVMHIYHSDDRRVYVDTLWRICDYAASLYVNAIMAGAPCSEKDKAIIIHYHKCACFGLLIDWISNGMKEEAVKDIDRLCFLKMGSLEALIRRSQENPIDS